ncbi:MAG: hypothetical protein A2W35_20915 [Chloroflexi bacterium RBG_16_57_11]|nr:MAG: hypothetical protein A2W35_20915 [Chloroflexi bacterium RBG_16_57_11]
MASHLPNSLPVCYSGNKLTLTITTIGTIAQEELAQTREASVIGKTSRGLFLHLASDWVAFLSFEQFRGPLTLNLRENSDALAGLEIGAQVQCSSKLIAFPSIRLSLPLAQAVSWRATEPTEGVRPPDLLRASLLSVLRLASQEYPDHTLLTSLQGMVSSQPAPDPAEPEFDPLLKRLLAACQAGEADAIATSLEAFLGLGNGLTPSGDDLVMGFLLAMSRWGRRQAWLSDGIIVQQHPSPRLRRQTSHLSASLIACAARGQADERLICALDALVTGSPEAGACLSILSTYGSSSGFDALVGMVIYLFHEGC